MGTNKLAVESVKSLQDFPSGWISSLMVIFTLLQTETFCSTLQWLRGLPSSYKSQATEKVCSHMLLAWRCLPALGVVTLRYIYVYIYTYVCIHIFIISIYVKFLGGSVVKNLPVIQETQVQSLGGKDPLEEGMAVHSSTLAQRVSWTEEPGELQSIGSIKSQTQLKQLGMHTCIYTYEFLQFSNKETTEQKMGKRFEQILHKI